MSCWRGKFGDYRFDGLFIPYEAHEVDVTLILLQTDGLAVDDWSRGKQIGRSEFSDQPF